MGSIEWASARKLWVDAFASWICHLNRIFFSKCCNHLTIFPSAVWISMRGTQSRPLWRSLSCRTGRFSSGRLQNLLELWVFKSQSYNLLLFVYDPHFNNCRHKPSLSVLWVPCWGSGAKMTLSQRYFCEQHSGYQHLCLNRPDFKLPGLVWSGEILLRSKFATDSLLWS